MMFGSGVNIRRMNTVYKGINYIFVLKLLTSETHHENKKKYNAGQRERINLVIHHFQKNRNKFLIN